MRNESSGRHADLATAVAYALALADEIGNTIVGCHLSAAQDALLGHVPWSPQDVEAAFTMVESAAADALQRPSHQEP